MTMMTQVVIYFINEGISYNLLKVVYPNIGGVWTNGGFFKLPFSCRKTCKQYIIQNSKVINKPITYIEINPKT